MQQTAHSSLPHTAGFAHPARNAELFGIEAGMSIADFGSGSGHYVWPMAEAVGPTGHVFAIDVQQDLLKRIHNEANKRGLKNVKIIWSDLEKPKGSKLADNALDLVLISNLLFQLEDKGIALREAKRILKPAGKLVLIDWLGSFSMMGPHKKDVVTKEAGRELAEQCGLKLVREFSAGAHHWGLMLRTA